MESPSRVLIGSLSTAQLNRVRRLLEMHADIETLGPIEDPVEVLLSAREMSATAVILPLRGSGKAPGLCTHLLAEYPGLVVLAISEDGERTFVFSNRIARRELDGDNVLRTIRLFAGRNKEV